MGNAVQIDNNSFDTVALALDFGLETLHLIAVEGIGNILSMTERDQNNVFPLELKDVGDKLDDIPDEC